jgi:hypothetical protein
MLVVDRVAGATQRPASMACNTHQMPRAAVCNPIARYVAVMPSAMPLTVSHYSPRRYVCRSSSNKVARVAFTSQVNNLACNGPESLDDQCVVAALPIAPSDALSAAPCRALQAYHTNLVCLITAFALAGPHLSPQRD